MSADNRQAVLRHLPALLFAALVVRYVVLVVLHNPTEPGQDPAIKESALAFVVSAVEFALFLMGSHDARGRAALFGLLALFWAILMLWVESW